MAREQDVPSDAIDAVIANWKRERPALDPSSIAVFGRLGRLCDQQRRIMTRLHDQLGLSLPAFDVLANLRRSGPPHRKTAGELAESSMLTSGGVTFRLDRMEADGLVERVRSTEDRRIVFVQLTDKGFEVIDRVIEEHLATERELLADLSDKEQEQLAALLRKLGHSLAPFDTRGATAPQRATGTSPPK